MGVLDHFPVAASLHTRKAEHAYAKNICPYTGNIVIKMVHLHDVISPCKGSSGRPGKMFMAPGSCVPEARLRSLTDHSRLYVVGANIRWEL